MTLPNGIAAIVADCERMAQPVARDTAQRRQVLFWLRRRCLCAEELAAKLGVVRVDTLRMTLTRMRLDRQICVVYRKWVEHELDGPGRRRHLVSYYRARV